MPELPEAHERLAGFYRERHAAAEAARVGRAAAQYEVLLRSHDRGHHAAYLKGDGEVTLVTEPAGAEITLYRFAPYERRLVPELIRSLGRTSLRAISLPMGS